MGIYLRIVPNNSVPKKFDSYGIYEIIYHKHINSSFVLVALANFQNYETVDKFYLQQYKV